MFQCNMCSSTFLSILRYNKHQILHKNTPHLKIICRFKNCDQHFKKYVNFRQHIFRRHTINSKREISETYYCSQDKCNTYFTNRVSFNKHLYNHLKQNKTGIRCGYTSCSANQTIFKTVSSYAVHICRRHFNCKSDKQCNVNKELTNFDTYNDTNIDISNGHNSFLQEETGCEALSDITSNVNSVEKAISQLYLNLTTKYFLTHFALQAVIDGMSSIVELTKEHFIETVNQSDLQDDVKEKIKDMFRCSFSFFSNVHNSIDGSLRNTYSRNVYFLNNFNIVMPEQINLGYNNNHKKCHYHYIPILKTIKVLLQHSDIRHFCLNSYNNYDSNVLFDIKDGSVIKNNNFFHNNKNALQIILYQDAFEVCNPLGASKKKFKLVGIYMVLGNLPAYLRSKVDNIQLVMLCHEKHITFFGWENIIEPLIRDLQSLEKKGIHISVDNNIINCTGTVVAMLGDNLGSHQIGGFTENFNSSEYFCRFCDITQNEFKSKYECTNINRNADNYNLNVTEAKSNMKAVKGIKYESPLNKLNYFHVCNPGLPPCIAHDLFEGIVPYDLMYCIKYFVTKNWFTYQFLNHRLQKINFFNNNVTIPIIKDSCKITGTASQIRKILLIFPLAVFDQLSEKEIKNNVWTMVLLLRKICFLICSPALSIGQIAFLRETINEYLSLRVKCFPHIKLRPKHHYISHYPSLILLFGPLKHLWTLRFESKHRYFKNIVKHSQNFKNVTKLLSCKHQYLQNEENLKNRFSALAIVDTAEEYISEKFDDQISSVITDYFCDKENENVKYISSQVTFRGITYKRHMCICVGKDCYDYFTICKIKYILISNCYTKIYFLGITTTIIYNPDFGVYEEFEMKSVHHNVEKLCLFPYTSLLAPHPVFETNLRSISVYAFKYEPLDL